MQKRLSNEEPGRLAGLDAMRALAILSVLLYDTPSHVGLPPAVLAVTRFGWTGVDLFFVLSGYLIGGQIFDTPSGHFSAGLRSFWIKRWTRTLPLYFIVLFFYAVLKPHLFGAPFRGAGWAYVLFLQNYTDPRDFSQSWSLCIEEHFYLLLPLVVLGLRRAKRWPGWVWLVPAVISALYRYGFLYLQMQRSPFGLGDGDGYLPPFLQFPTHAHLDGISVGLFLARIARRPTGWPEPSDRWVLVPGVLLLAVTFLAFGPSMHNWVTWTIYLTSLATAFGMCLVGIRHLQLAGTGARVIYWLATYSYGAYLWHGLIVRVCDHVLAGAIPWPVKLAVYLGGTWLCAIVTYHTIEIPGLRLRKLLLAPPRWPREERA